MFPSTLLLRYCVAPSVPRSISRSMTTHKSDTTMISKSDPIAIVGGGAFGLSTAYHLLHSGYSDITVFEQDTQIPSKYSAANDLNKIMRVEYEDPWYTDLTLKALEGWKTPVFAPYFHQVGFLHCVSGTAPQRAIDTLNRFRNAATKDNRIVRHVSDVAKLSGNSWGMPGDFPGWEGYFNRLDGYTHSADALRAVHHHLNRRGVKFTVDPVAGKVEGVIHDSTGKTTGVQTGDDNTHPAALVIIAAGAMVSKLLPQLGQQVVAKSWTVAHIQLTTDEASVLMGMPVTYARDLGFMFEPDPAKKLLKICPMGGGYINTNHATRTSLPPSNWNETADFLPAEDEHRIRQLLREAIPDLAERPLVRTSLCWFADTADSDFIMDYVPGSNQSVMVLSGDSGHGFKMFPIVGQWAVDLLDSGNDRQAIDRWRWKEHTTGNAKGQESWGNSVSWRLGGTREFADVKSEVKASKP